jgi:hypothetical protein
LRESMAIFEQRSETCLQKYPAVEQCWWQALISLCCWRLVIGS